MEPPQRDPGPFEDLTETDAYATYSQLRMAKVGPNLWKIVAFRRGIVQYGWIDKILGVLCITLQMWAEDSDICYIRRDFGEPELKAGVFRQFDLTEVARRCRVNVSAYDKADKMIDFMTVERFTHLRGEVETDMGNSTPSQGPVLTLGELALRVVRPRRVLEASFKAHGHDIHNAKRKYVFDDEVGPIWKAQLLLWFRRYGDVDAEEVEIRRGHDEPRKAKLTETGDIIHRICLQYPRIDNVMITLLPPPGQARRPDRKTYLLLQELYIRQPLKGV